MGDIEVGKRLMPHQFQEKAKEILQEMKKGTDICSYLLINRDDGSLKQSDLPDEVHGETVGIMYATMYGAAVTTNGELKKKLPQNLIVNYDDGAAFITTASDKYFLAVTLEKADSLKDELKERVLKAAQEISDLV